MKREDTEKNADLAIGVLKETHPGIRMKELRTIVGKMYAKLIDEVKNDPDAVVPGELKKTSAAETDETKAEDKAEEEEEESSEDSDESTDNDEKADEDKDSDSEKKE